MRKWRGEPTEEKQIAPKRHISRKFPTRSRLSVRQGTNASAWLWAAPTARARCARRSPGDSRAAGQNPPGPRAPRHLHAPGPAPRRLSALLILPEHMCGKRWESETYKRLSHGILKWTPPQEGLTLMAMFLSTICITTWRECLKSSLPPHPPTHPLFSSLLLPPEDLGLSFACSSECGKRTESKIPFE